MVGLGDLLGGEVLPLQRQPEPQLASSSPSAETQD